MPDSPGLAHRPEWTALENHRAGALLHPDLRGLFDRDPERARRCTVRVGDPLAGCSKHYPHPPA